MPRPRKEPTRGMLCMHNVLVSYELLGHIKLMNVFPFIIWDIFHCQDVKMPPIKEKSCTSSIGVSDLCQVDTLYPSVEVKDQRIMAGAPLSSNAKCQEEFIRQPGAEENHFLNLFQKFR
jgi:hypothetical protein